MATRTDEQRLLASAGFVEVEHLDVTADFARTAGAWLEEAEGHADELIAQQGAGSFAERQRERRTQLAAVEDGLLRRSLFAATRA